MPMRCIGSASLLERCRAYSLAQLKQHQGKDRIRGSGNRGSCEPPD